MLQKKLKKLTSGLMVGMVSATLVGQNTTVLAIETSQISSTENTTQTNSTASTDNTAQVVQAKERVSVHDPSIVKEEGTGKYYVFGSHIEAAKSTDLQNWTSFANGYAKTGNVLFGDLSKNLAGSFAWAGENDSDSKGGFAVWAPNVIWNPTYVIDGESEPGAYMMYYCTSSTYKRSAIGYAVSKTIEGPYTYVDTIMYSGFTKGDATDANSTINTNVQTLIDKGEVPEDVNSKWFNADGSYNTGYAPNAIDPELFYDEDGKLWMSYGSWSGGIYMLEINQTTGKPMYPGKDNETDSASSVNYTDRFFGKHIAGGFTQSGEGAEIVYDKANGQYYLYMTYAGLTANGGYNMRMFRSTSPTGPFVDAKGQNAAWDKTADNIDYGIKLIGNYKFDCLDVGYKAAGHNSSFIDADGKMYLLHHQRFDNGTENHEVRVHQMFLNEDKWPVVAPYENSGDEISATGYSQDEIVGNYQFINHGHSNSAAMLDTLSVKLTSDGKITGDVTGTWSMTNGSYYMNAIIDGVTYKGVFFKQQDESQYENKVMTFSAVGDNNEVIWGSKLELSDNDALKYVENVLENKIPDNTKTNLTLPNAAAYDTTISWSSSDTDVLSSEGVVNRPEGADKVVTLTATITAKGGTSITKTFTVLVKGQLDFNGVPIYKYNFTTISDKSISNSGSKGTSIGASATLVGTTSAVVDDADRGKVLEVKNTSGAINANYLALPNNSFSGIGENGFTVSMWVNVDTSDPNYFEHSALFEADRDVKNFPMTRIGANLIARINANGSYADSDKASLTPKTWQYLTYTVGTTGIVVYLDGVEVGRQDKDITSSLAGNFLANINNVRVGSGSIWNDKDIASAKFDNVALYNKALTDQEVESLYKKEVAGDTEITVTDQQAVDFAANDLVSSIPSSTDKDIILPVTGAYDATISWSSDDTSVLGNDGTVTRSENADKEVTLTATIIKGDASTTKTFKVTVIGMITNFNLEPTYKYDFSTNLSGDISNSGSATGNATLKGTASIADDEDRGKVLQIKNTGGTKVNYLALPSNTFNGITDEGYTVSMWVNVDQSDPNYLENSALFEANGGGKFAYPMTRIGANLLARINANGGWIDTGATGLPSNTWQYVTYTVDPTGLSVYLNGKQVARVNKSIPSSFENNVLAGMTDVRVGSGNIFGDSDLASAKFDNVAVFNTSLTGQQVEALYKQENESSDPLEAAINSVVTTPASVTLAPGKTKQLTATVDAVGGADETVTWSSNDESNKVTVDQDGLVSVAADAALGDYEIKAVSTVDSSKFGITTVKVADSSEIPDEPDAQELSITKQPNSLSLRKGTTAVFEIGVAGTAPFSYQWQKGKVDLLDGDGISGANESVLKIQNVKKSDAGNYSCIVTDGIGNVTTSSAVTLSIRSGSSSSSSSSSSNSSSNSAKSTDSVTTTNDEASLKNAIKTSATKTIVINVDNSTQINKSLLLTQDILVSLKVNSDKTLVIKTNDSSIEIKSNNGQIQFTQNGTAITGFKAVGQAEYYLDSNGIMQTGWLQTSDNNWYYLDKATGVKKSDWVQEANGSWYYLDRTSGAMKTGWMQDTNGSWYYLDKTQGNMKTGWIKDNDKWYYLHSDGSLALKTTIDGYVVNEKGEWVK